MKYTVSFRASAHRDAIEKSSELPSLEQLLGRQSHVVIVQLSLAGSNALVEVSPENIQNLREQYGQLIFARHGKARSF